MNLIFTNDVAGAIDTFAGTYSPTKVFVIVDYNTSAFVLPRLQAESETISGATVITVKAGDMNKNLDSLQTIWRGLAAGGCTRRSLIVNLGGGVVTDMGAFAAATFKRGVTFINVPTTLLGAVDASVGGKTGINWGGFKNQIGTFADAALVVVSTTFFNTLNTEELRSGYAEMLKHALLESQTMLDEILACNVTDIDPDALLELLEKSVGVKKKIVDADPTEKSLRRVLNLGHTAGHAFESLALERKSPIPHGYAVAWGLIPALVLSHTRLGFPSATLHTVAAYVRENYGTFSFSCKDYPALLSYMAGDKKNDAQGRVNFTLLRAVGEPVIDNILDAKEIETALDITCDLL